MKAMLQLRIVHPYLFGIFPILSLYSHNSNELQPHVMLAPLVVMLGGVWLTLRLLQLFSIRRRLAALLVSISVVLIFSYGHIRSGIAQVRLFETIGADKLTFALCLVLFVSVSYYFLRSRQRLAMPTAFANVMALTLVTVTGIAIMGDLLQVRPFFGLVSENKGAKGISVTMMNGKKDPDIYYIVLDGYGRADTIKNQYGYDNHKFLEFLESRGFYIARQSRSNYVQTSLSIASALNFQYLDVLMGEVDRQSSSLEPLRKLIQDSRLVRYLRDRGYRFVAFATGYDLTSIKNAEAYLGPITLGEFNDALIRTTALRLVFEWLFYIEYDVHRDRIRYTLSELGRIPQRGGTKFVFAHVFATHPPFVLGPNGESIQPKRLFGYHDGIGFLQLEGASREEYIEGYRNQLQYSNSELMKSVDQILKESHRNVIIIIQGDHGPRLEMDWKTGKNPECRGCFGILNAYYLPSGGKGMLYPEISPVNSFRIVLKQYFDAELDLLPDFSYYSPVSQPYDFQKVSTDKIK